VTLPLLVLLSSLHAGAFPSDTDTAYDRVLERALVRAEADLIRSTDLWVDHSSWENAWEVSSAHYTVRTTESRYLAKDVGEGLEIMLGHFQNILGTDFVPNQPFLVLIFPTLSEYNVFGNSVGAEHSSALGNFYADQDPNLAIATYFVQYPTLLRMWITHSATHQFVARAFRPSLSTGISEGLASYFSLYWDRRHAADEHNRLKDSPAYVPLERLLQGSVQQILANPNDGLMELGLFFNYLLHYREDTRMAEEGAEEPENSFVTYLRLAVRGQDTSDTGFERLLRRNFEAMEEDFRAFSFPR
jgi:hypothetical protein